MVEMEDAVEDAVEKGKMEMSRVLVLEDGDDGDDGNGPWAV